MLVEILLVLLAGVLAFVYLYGQYNERYWKKRGLKFDKKRGMIGPFKEYITGSRALFEIIGDLYSEYENEPAVGIGSFLTPALFIRDATNVSHVLQMDFNSFNHRGFENLEGDQLSENILFLNGPKWKLMRQSMTPLFTATKLKNMYYIMDKGAQDLVQYMKEHPEKLRGNAYDTMTNYCCAAITASVFGISTESIFNSPFLDVAKASTAPSLKMNLKFALANLSPRLVKLFGLTIFTEHEDFFIGAIKQVLDKRDEEKVKRHDFADIALSIQKNGILRDESTGCEMDPTVGLLSAQAFFFFIAGVEPSATTLFCALVELGRNPDVLKKVHEEIDNAFETHNNTINYDVLSEMHYLEKVLHESMRVFPPIGYLTRQCVQDTVLPVGNIKVEKDTKIFTPIYHIHHDPKYYPDPEKFDPERFDHEGNLAQSGTFYMPFGRGNRICIGTRFARLQVKAALVHLLRYFSVNTLTQGPIKFKKEMVNVRPRNVDVEFMSRNIRV